MAFSRVGPIGPKAADDSARHDSRATPPRAQSRTRERLLEILDVRR
jgi:hypothetical protein